MIVDLMAESWEDITQMNAEKLVVFLGIAPIEEHGRHLPIGVDIYETNHWIHKAAERLDSALPDYCFAILPTIPLGFADMGQFPGNIHVSRRLIFDVVYETTSAIARWDVHNIIIISAHADPLHAIAVEQACEKTNKEHGDICLAPMGAIFNLGPEDTSAAEPSELPAMQRNFPDDFHAGWIETSCMLSILPQYVKSDYMKRPNIVLQGREMTDGQKVAAAIAGEGHIGFPKLAAASLGAELNNDMAEKIKTAVCCFVKREDFARYMKHPLHDILSSVPL